MDAQLNACMQTSYYANGHMGDDMRAVDPNSRKPSNHGSPIQQYELKLTNAIRQNKAQEEDESYAAKNYFVADRYRNKNSVLSSAQRGIVAVAGGGGKMQPPKAIAQSTKHHQNQSIIFADQLSYSIPRVHNKYPPQKARKGEDPLHLQLQINIRNINILHKAPKGEAKQGRDAAQPEANEYQGVSPKAAASAEDKDKLQQLSAPISKRGSRLLNSISRPRANGKGGTDEKNLHSDPKTSDAADRDHHINEQAFKVDAPQQAPNFVPAKDTKDKKHNTGMNTRQNKNNHKMKIIILGDPKTQLPNPSSDQLHKDLEASQQESVFTQKMTTESPSPQDDGKLKTTKSVPKRLTNQFNDFSNSQQQVFAIKNVNFDFNIKPMPMKCNVATPRKIQPFSAYQGLQKSTTLQFQQSETENAMQTRGSAQSQDSKGSKDSIRSERGTKNVKIPQGSCVQQSLTSQRIDVTSEAQANNASFNVDKSFDATMLMSQIRIDSNKTSPQSRYQKKEHSNTTGTQVDNPFDNIDLPQDSLYSNVMPNQQMLYGKQSPKAGTSIDMLQFQQLIEDKKLFVAHRDIRQSLLDKQFQDKYKLSYVKYRKQKPTTVQFPENWLGYSKKELLQQDHKQLLDISKQINIDKWPIRKRGESLDERSKDVDTQISEVNPQMVNLNLTSSSSSKNIVPGNMAQTQITDHLKALDQQYRLAIDCEYQTLMSKNEFEITQDSANQTSKRHLKNTLLFPQTKLTIFKKNRNSIAAQEDSLHTSKSRESSASAGGRKVPYPPSRQQQDKQVLAQSTVINLNQMSELTQYHELDSNNKTEITERIQQSARSAMSATGEYIQLDQPDNSIDQALIQQQKWRKQIKKKIDKQLSRKCNQMLVFGKTVQKPQRGDFLSHDLANLESGRHAEMYEGDHIMNHSRNGAFYQNRKTHQMNSRYSNRSSMRSNASRRCSSKRQQPQQCSRKHDRNRSNVISSKQYSKQRFMIDLTEKSLSSQRRLAKRQSSKFRNTMKNPKDFRISKQASTQSQVSRGASPKPTQLENIDEKVSTSLSNKFLETFSLVKAQTSKDRFQENGNAQPHRDLQNISPITCEGRRESLLILNQKKGDTPADLVQQSSHSGAHSKAPGTSEDGNIQPVYSNYHQSKDQAPNKLIISEVQPSHVLQNPKRQLDASSGINFPKLSQASRPNLTFNPSSYLLQQNANTNSQLAQYQRQEQHQQPQKYQLLCLEPDSSMASQILSGPGSATANLLKLHEQKKKFDFNKFTCSETHNEKLKNKSRKYQKAESVRRSVDTNQLQSLLGPLKIIDQKHRYRDITPEDAMAEYAEHLAHAENPFPNSTERVDILKRKHGYVQAVQQIEKQRISMLKNKQRVTDDYNTERQYRQELKDRLMQLHNFEAQFSQSLVSKANGNSTATNIIAAEQNLTLPKIQQNTRSSVPEIGQNTKSQVRFTESFGGWTTFSGGKRSVQVNPSDQQGQTNDATPNAAARNNNGSIIKIVEINPHRKSMDVDEAEEGAALVDQVQTNMDQDFFENSNSSMGQQVSQQQTARNTSANLYSEQEIMQAFKNIMHPQQAKLQSGRIHISKKVRQQSQNDKKKIAEAFNLSQLGFNNMNQASESMVNLNNGNEHTSNKLNHTDIIQDSSDVSIRTSINNIQGYDASQILRLSNNNGNSANKKNAPLSPQVENQIKIFNSSAYQSAFVQTAQTGFHTQGTSFDHVTSGEQAILEKRHNETQLNEPPSEYTSEVKTHLDDAQGDSPVYLGQHQSSCMNDSYGGNEFQKSYQHLEDFKRTSKDVKSLTVSSKMFHPNKSLANIKKDNYKYFKRMDGVVQLDLEKVYAEKVPPIKELLASVSEQSLL